MTPVAATAWIGALALVAIAVASVAIVRALAVRAARRADEGNRGEKAELNRRMEATNQLAGDIAHDLNDLLTAITGQTELLIASLDPSGTSILDAYEIRRFALSAARLTKQLRTLSGSPRPVGAAPTFTMDGPAALEPAAATDPALADTPVKALVLIVEDEPGVRELIRAILVRAGHEVVAVAGPHAALVALRRQPTVSLMLVDVVMPEMDGYDLVAEARTIVPGVRVVFISAFACDPRRHASGDGFLAKPFTAEALSDIVEDALEIR